MRAIKITGLLVITAFAAYSMLWYYNGKASLRQTETWLENLANHPMIESMSYDSLSLKGYPFSIKLVIHKPKMTVDLLPLVKSVMAMHPTSTEKPQQTSMTVYYDDDFIIKTNAIGSAYTMMSTGDIHITQKTADGEFHLRETSEDRYVKIRLNWFDALAHHGNLEKIAQYKPSISDANSKVIKALEAKNLENLSFLFYEVNKIKLYSKKVTGINELNDEVMYTADEVRYEISHKDLGDNRMHAGLLLEAINFNATQEYLNETMNLTKRLGFKTVTSPALESYQDANILLDINYDGPSHFKETIDGLIHADVQVAFDNKLYHYDNKGVVDVNYKEGELVDVNIDIGDSAKFSPKSYNYFMQAYQNILTNIEKETPTTNRASEVETKKMFAFLRANAQEVVPKLHELGQMNGGLKLHAQQLGASLFDFNINDISFINELYGLAMSGQLKLSTVVPIPTGNLDLAMTGFEVMLDRFNPYLNFAVRFFDEYNMPKPTYLDKQFTPRLKTFLRALSNANQEDKDIVLKAKFQAKPPFVDVGGKSQDEILMLFMEIFPPPPPPPVVASPTDIE